MKGIVHLSKRWLRNSPGFTLLELTVAMTVGSFIMGGVFAVWTQLFSVTAVNSNYMAAFRQVQNSGDWISRDTLMTQEAYDMASALLAVDVDEYTDEITVDSTNGFPPSGVICIEDEIIQYTGIDYDNNKFIDCTRGYNATGHNAGDPATVLVALNWTTWSGDQHQVVYSLKETSHQLVRSYFVDPREPADPQIVQWEPRSSTIIAEAIVVGETTSEWDPDQKQLKVKITASVGGYILGKFGIQSQIATRTYDVHPRPFF